jgi:sterol 3beta-glucosyltransferase
VNLVKIQNDGTVEVDITKGAPVASELLELHTAERAHINVVDLTCESNKSIPRLKIAILVVGTRGDVQTFLAIAKRLQVFTIIYLVALSCQDNSVLASPIPMSYAHTPRYS